MLLNCTKWLYFDASRQGKQKILDSKIQNSAVDSYAERSPWELFSCYRGTDHDRVIS